MLKRVVHSLGLVQHSDKKSRRKKQQLKEGGDVIAKANHQTQELSLIKSENNIFVKIVHEGGQKELYQHAVAASKLMEKYPGMCVALPEVFRDPHQSVLWPEEILMPGQKYIIISCKAVEKLKRKYPEELDRTVMETKLASKEDDDDDDMEKKGVSLIKIEKEGKVAMTSIEEALCGAKDMNVCEEKKTRRRGMRGKKKPFVPPLPKANPCRSLGWQPNLSPVEELSL